MYMHESLTLGQVFLTLSNDTVKLLSAHKPKLRRNCKNKSKSLDIKRVLVQKTEVLISCLE